MDYSVYKAKQTYFFSRPPLHPSCYGTRQVGALSAAHASRALLLVRLSVRLPDALSHDPASSHFLPAPHQTLPTTASLTLALRPPSRLSYLTLTKPRRPGAGSISRSASICHCRCRCCLLYRLKRSSVHLDSLEPVTSLIDPKVGAQPVRLRRFTPPPPRGQCSTTAAFTLHLTAHHRPLRSTEETIASTWAQCAN